MAKIHVKRIWWRLLRPYRVEWKDAYIIHEDKFQVYGFGNYSREVHRIYFRIHPRVKEFLDGLPPVSFLWFKYPASEYILGTARRAPRGLKMYVNKHGELQIGEKPPAFYVARRSYAMMLRLSCDLG